MNKFRRTKISSIVNKLEEIKVIIDEVSDEEQTSFDNLPEGIQISERGSMIEENASLIEEQALILDGIITELQTVIE